MIAKECVLVAKAKNGSPAGNRTRVFRVKAEYPNRLDYRGKLDDLLRTVLLKSVHCTLSLDPGQAPTSSHSDRLAPCKVFVFNPTD